MFLKGFDYSIEMQKMKRKFNNRLMNYGLIGEERVSHQLKLLDQYVVCLYNIRMNIKGIKLQIDYVVITNNNLYLIEVKNLLGNIHIEKNCKIIRKVFYNNIYKESSMENPFNQMNRHKELIETFLEYNGIVKQVQNLLVMANDKMIIENESPNANIIKYDEIINFIKSNEELSYYKKDAMLLGKLILKYDEQYNYFMLKVIKKNIDNQYVPKFENYYELDLYLKLLKIRKEISKSKNIPPCNIFNNREAELLVINKPTTKAEFVGVKGFKEKRYEMFGEEFIILFKNS